MEIVVILINDRLINIGIVEVIDLSTTPWVLFKALTLGLFALNSISYLNNFLITSHTFNVHILFSIDR